MKDQEVYFKEYFNNEKFLGYVNDVIKDRLFFGFKGQEIETLQEDIILENKKKIKKGTIVKTYLQILCKRKF